MKSEEPDFLKELMIHVSKKIGKPYSALSEMEEQLRKNWYDSPEAIGGITDEQFQKMGIPLRVSSILREEVGGLQCKSPRQSRPPRQPNAVKEEPEVKRMKKESSKPPLNQATILILVGRLQDQLLQKYPWVGPEILKIFQTLHKIIKNIAADSYEYKYRVLKKSNGRIKEVILDNPPVLKFLKEIGFEEDQETVFLDAVDTNVFFYIEDCLEAMVENHKKQNQHQNNAINKAHQKVNKANQPLFLPPDLKLPSSESGGVSLQGSFPKEQLEQANYAQMLEKLIDFRKKIMSTAPKDRKVRIYHKRHDKKAVPHFVFDMEHELEVSDNAVIANYWKKVIKNNQKNANFQSKRKTQFEFLISQQVYKETTIKLRLPNQLIIEARFGPLETLADVFALTAEIVIGEFYIYQAPPVKMLEKQMHRTLDSLDSVPFGSFYVGLKSEWYIKNQYYTKIIQ